MIRGLIYTATASLVVVSLVSVQAGSRGSTRTHVGAGSIAAGRAHTVIAKPSGNVFAWGAGGRGQLGVGGLGDRLSPMEVPGLGGIVAVSAGAAHTVALSATGEVYAWGANTFGRLGDGTRKRSDRPVRILGLEAVRKIAAGRAHTLALTEDGRVFAWGFNAHGQAGKGRKNAVLTPTPISGLSDVVAIAAGDAHSLAATRDGRLFAWGRNAFSALGDGTTKDRDTPVLVGLRDVVSLAAGGGHSLALLRSGAVYSWGRGANGELGTGHTKVASTPKIIPGLTASAIAAGLHFSGAITTGGQVVTWGANGSGQLGDGTTTRRLRPVPVQGVTSAVSIALGDLHAAAVTNTGDIRVWGEGERGRLGSGTLADHGTPVEILSDIADWGEEPGDEPEPVDSTPPTIRAVVSPPLQEGWMTSPVTVSFECADDVVVVSCSGPLEVNQDGVTAVTGAVRDAAGNQSIVTVTVRLDRLPPVATIAGAPESIDAENVVVIGTVVDAASGVVDAHCNGEPITVVDGAFSCAVQLRPGRNDVVVSARDAMGHETSTAAIVSRVGAPTALFLTPASRAVGLDEVVQLMLRDEYGAVVQNAAWTFEDEGVVSVSADDPPAITAIGLGATVVAAQKDGLRAEAVIRVLPAIAAGDERWSLPSTPSLSPEPPLLANRVTADGAHIFAIDYEDWDRKVVRGVSSEGEVLWQQQVAGIPLFADSFGGVVSGVTDAIGDVRAFARFGGGSIKSWRYNSPGALDRPAQALDGTIYVAETVKNALVVDGAEMWDLFAVAIDGATGQVLSRTKLPSDLNQFVSAFDGRVLDTSPPLVCRSYRYEFGPQVGAPIAGADGRGYFLVNRQRIVKRDSCLEPKGLRPARTIEKSIDLVVLSRTAAPKTINVFSIGCEAAEGTTLLCDYPVRIEQLMPDGIGGTLVTWEGPAQSAGQPVVMQTALTRVEADGTVTARAFNRHEWIEKVGQDGMALIYGGDYRAEDLQTGEPKWTGHGALTPLAVRPDGGVAAIDWNTHELAMVNGTGAIESRHPFGLDWRAFHSGGDWIGLKGQSIAAVAGTFSDATRFSNFSPKTGQQAERTPGIGIWLKTHDVIVPNLQHASIRVTPADQTWLLNNRSRFETCDPSQDCVPLGKDDFGNHFFTIGAGAGTDDTNLQCNGILTKGFNRRSDVTKLPAQPMTALPVDLAIQPILINSLISRVDAFANNLAYHCFPEERPGHYNSNSFAHGLLHAASVAHDESPPTLRRIPGWITPVFRDAFFKQ